MGIKEFLDILNDEDRELDWDECWDRLMALKDDSEASLKLLMGALNGQTEFVRIAAIRKLSQSSLAIDSWAGQLCKLLSDEDSNVRDEALKAARPHLSSSPALASEVKTMQNRGSEYVGLRIKRSEEH